MPTKENTMKKLLASTLALAFIFTACSGSGSERCEALAPECGWEWNEEIQEWEDMWK